VRILFDITVVLTTLYGLMILFFLVGMSIRRRGTVTANIRVSVIIAARNEAQNIGAILNDLIHQSYDPAFYEVIVADDHSTDATAAMVEALAKCHPFIKLLKITDAPPRFSPKKYAIQQAVEMARGDIILATDADCTVGSEWIRTMASYFEESVGFVIGFSQFGVKNQQQNLIERLQAFDFVTLMGVAAGSTNLGFPLAASGQNMGYRKSMFEQVDGYRRLAHRVSGDDVLLMQLIKGMTRCRIAFAADPRAHAVSQPQSTLRSLINQRKRWASNGAYQLFLNPVFFGYLLLVLLFNAACAIGPATALITHQYVVPMLGCIAGRGLLELLISCRSAVYFNRTDLIKYFPLWFVVQIPYIVGVGIAGTFGRFSWKERQHSAQIK
jgi:cellulose synthase/poly-beta-1,6-N-acetylglucosamine synthase-like glycosyltransferase